MTLMVRMLSVLALSIALSSAASAQDKKSKKEEATLRSVQGTVVDNQDKPVVGAVVQLKDTRTLQMRSYITKANGEYHFMGLRVDDDYEVEAMNNHLTSGPKKISIFDSRKIVIQNLKADKPEKKQ
jgi:Carboxypeptidase regulatory-like domain